MSLTKKSILVWFVVLLLCTIVFLAVARAIVVNGFTHVEHESARSDMQLVLRRLNENLDEIEKEESNYTIWDDTYNFIGKRHSAAWDAAYLKSNYGASTYESNGLNVIVMFNRQGQVVYGQAFDLEHDKFLPLPSDLVSDIQKRAPSLLHPGQKYQSTKGILSLAQGELLVSVAPVVHSDYSGPADGTMLMGVFLNKDVLSTIQSATQLHISMAKPTSNILSEPSSSKLSHIGSISYSMWLVRGGSSNVVANAFLQGLDNRPAIGLEVPADPTMYIESQQVIHRFVVFTILVLFLFATLGVLMMDMSITKRMRKIHQQLGLIRNSADVSSRLEINGHDEIARIATEFNRVMSALEASQETIMRQARYDQLTGLPNRHLIMGILHSFMKQADERKEQVVVLFLDFNKFKTINDTYGHAVGDALLREVAKRLLEIVSSGGAVARFAGDEFIILLPAIHPLHDSGTFVQNMQDVLAQPIQINETVIRVNASIGGSIYPVDSDCPEQLIHYADMAMYEAKRTPGVDFMLITDDIKQSIQRRNKLELDLKTATANHEMFVVYQPKIDVTTLSVNGVEALLRWNHPQFGFISPVEFIAIAESTLSIVPIGLWVLESACRQVALWLQQGVAPLSVAVNVSAIQLMQDTFVEDVLGVLESTGLLPELLELEFTEGVMMTHVDTCAGKLRALQEVGVQLSMDDFGTGYSSLNYLKHLPVDVVKLDKSFMENIAVAEQDRIIVGNIIEMIHRLGMKVLAEGVEISEQHIFLNDSNCDFAQGYLYGRPVTADELQSHLARRVHLA